MVLDDLSQRLRQAETPTDKERLQLLYWLKQEIALSISAEAEHHAVYQMTRDRLKAKLKLARPQSYKHNSEQQVAFEQTLHST